MVRTGFNGEQCLAVSLGARPQLLDRRLQLVMKTSVRTLFCQPSILPRSNVTSGLARQTVAVQPWYQMWTCLTLVLWAVWGSCHWTLGIRWVEAETLSRLSLLLCPHTASVSQVHVVSLSWTQGQPTRLMSVTYINLKYTFSHTNSPKGLLVLSVTFQVTIRH